MNCAHLHVVSVIFTSVLLLCGGLSVSGSGDVRSSASHRIIAEGTYEYGHGPKHEHWVLSKTDAARYIVEGTATENLPEETEFLNYRIEMGAALHPSIVELHTTADLPSYTCKLTTESAECVLAFEPPNEETRAEQKVHLKAPFDLVGFHSYGWILSSIVSHLRGGQKQTTVRLFLPGEERYPNAVVVVRREGPESIKVAGTTFEALKYTLRFDWNATESGTNTVWTSRSGLVLKSLASGGASGAELPAVELVQYKQTESFVSELPATRSN